MSHTRRLLAVSLSILAFTLAGHLGAASKPLAGYTVIVVEPMTVDKGEATKDFQDGWEILLHKGMVRQLLKRKAFTEVVDQAAGSTGGGAPAAAAAAAGATTVKRVILTSTVILYDKGSRAARFMIGMGAGAAKTRVRFVFKDGETGQEVFRAEREGKYAGWLSSTGGTKEEAVMESAGDVVDRLLEDIKKNR